MVASFFQKPIGAVTLLGTAIGAPYAIFETDAGMSARVAIQKMIGSTTGGTGVAGAESLGAGAVGAGSLVPAGSSPTIVTDPNFSAASYPPGTVVSPVGAPVILSNGGTVPTTAMGSMVPATTMPSNLIPASGGYGAATYGSPYTATSNPVPATFPMTFGGVPSNPAMPANGPGAALPIAPNWAATGVPAATAPMSGGPSPSANISDFREVLRFDIGPSFVTSRFAQVTTVAANRQFDAYRVPFVSGTRPTDIAGTLTYYFDANQTVQRIQMQGSMGDPAVLVQLMVAFYHLAPEKSLGGQFYATRWNGRVTSMLLVSPAPIIHAGATYGKYSVFLELNQPSHQYALSEEATQILMQTQVQPR
jgi:hypothetical protein